MVLLILFWLIVAVLVLMLGVNLYDKADSRYILALLCALLLAMVAHKYVWGV